MSFVLVNMMNLNSKYQMAMVYQQVLWDSVMCKLLMMLFMRCFMEPLLKI